MKKDIHKSNASESVTRLINLTVYIKPILVILFVILIMHSQELSARQNIAIIPWHTGNDSCDIIADECAKRTEIACADFGVYDVRTDVQTKIIREAISKRNKGEISASTIQQASDSDRTIIILVSHEGVKYTATVYLIIKNEANARRMTVRTGIPTIIPNLVIREIIDLHEKTYLEVFIKKVNTDGTVIIDAGEYNNLKNGITINVSGIGHMRIISTGRFESVASCDFNVSEGMRLDVIPRVDINEYKATNENAIHMGLVKTFGAENTIQKGVPDPEKRFIEGVLVVSMGGSLILPAYGSFLSTYYMGFKNPEPAYGGLLMSASLEFGALLYTPFTTEKASWRSYVPIRSSDKSKRDLRLQKYLWSTVPFTFAVTYCDQLSYQYELRKVLPPLFEHPDRTASVLSIFIPGGGFFYKGYRVAGWGAYCSELALGGYAVSEFGSKKSRNALIALGVVKIVEIFSSAMISSSYDFYKREYDKSSNSTFSFNIFPDQNGKMEYFMGYTVSF